MNPPCFRSAAIEAADWLGRLLPNALAAFVVADEIVTAKKCQSSGEKSSMKFRFL
jgi:hypothetical protein